MMRSSNPVLKVSAFSNSQVDRSEGVMTVAGTINKTLFLTLLVLMTASFTWGKFMTGGASATSGLLLLGLIVGIGAALVTVFKQEWAHISAPVYAGAQGLFLGGVSAMFESSYPGIAGQAVAGTVGTLVCMLLAYRSGWIRVTDKFRMGVVAATGGIALVYLLSMIMGFFGLRTSLMDSGLLGIGFSLFVVGVAALNLVLDFDAIEAGARQGAPKQMEWYGAFGLMVTLIWLYMEMLRLISKLRDNK
jgi:uncharacterized YccA/Bax inhibitor family protein